MYFLCSENKGADQLRGICAFVFAYAKGRFCDEAVHIMGLSVPLLNCLHSPKKCFSICSSNSVFLYNINIGSYCCQMFLNYDKIFTKFNEYIKLVFPYVLFVIPQVQ